MRISDINDFEKSRWSVFHQRDSGPEPMELRFTITKDAAGGCYVTVFADDDPAGTPRLSMPLHPEHIAELRDDIEEIYDEIFRG